MAVIVVVTAPINALRVLFLAAWTGAVPSLVGRSQVGRANGYSEAIFSLSFIVGPSIAGILVGLIGAGQTLTIDAVSFLISAASLTLVRRPLQQARRGEPTHLVADILEGLRYIVRQPTLRTIITYWTLTSVLSASLVNAVIFLLTIEQKQSTEILGLILSGYGVGYTVGAVVAGRFARGRLGLFMVGSTFTSALCVALFALVPNPLLQGIFGAGAGLTGALGLISYVTMRATIPPDHLLGRVGSTARMLSLGLSPIGVFTGGVLLDGIGGSGTMLLMASGLFVVSVLFAVVPTMRNATAAPARPERAACGPVLGSQSVGCRPSSQGIRRVCAEPPRRFRPAGPEPATTHDRRARRPLRGAPCGAPARAHSAWRAGPAPRPGRSPQRDYVDWSFSRRVVIAAIVQLQANWMADYRNSDGITLERRAAGTGGHHRGQHPRGSLDPAAGGSPVLRVYRASPRLRGRGGGTPLGNPPSTHLGTATREPRPPFPGAHRHATANSRGAPPRRHVHQ